MRLLGDREGVGALRPSWGEIDLDALVGNLTRVRERVGGARVLGVVKADAYGHGAPVSPHRSSCWGRSGASSSRSCVATA